MSSFGDYEPEDAWCATDTVPDLVTNLRRRAAVLDAGPLTTSETLEALERRVLIFIDARGSNLTDRELVRAAELMADLEWLRSRIRSGG